jgi:hypothetical protein
MMKKIYADTWGLFRKGALAFALMGVMLEVLTHYFQSDGSMVGFAGASIVLAFYMHRSFLSGEEYFSRSAMFNKPKYDQGGIFKFVALAFGLFFLTAILALVLAFAIVGVDSDENDVLLFALIAATLANWLVLSLFGTILPAAADRNPGFSLKAGMAKFWVMLLRLLLGPLLATIASLVIIFVLAAVQSAIGLENNFWFERGIGVFAFISALFLLALTAATLCSVYRMIVPAPEPILV